ncbi:ABC transporter ATP-binding protein [Clostridium hydrogenum]|uniref:ABC transporter ATP-binding protein n=1 Tax=Clostridium hydrogenum TaxID=2855764 RepID=UPI001F451C0C|nr:ATP-binding cassette domain-containing protein [Clostridium hydrogenum]
MQNMIEVEHIVKMYGDVKALDDISFSVKKGELIGVLGRNGAGKSTMFKILCSVLKADSGRIYIDNQTNRFDHISYLPEVRGLNPRELVFDQLVDLLCYKGIRRSVAKNMVREQLALCKMDNYKDKQIADLSKGNQQKIQFISAIANNPEVLILDEPFSGLDVISADFFWNTILRLVSNGTTILFSTHSLEEKLEHCDKFMFVAKGKILEYDSLSEIQKRNSLVLELVCPSLKREFIEQKLEGKEYSEKSGHFYITIASDSEAQEIFNVLGSPYCTKFIVRKRNIDELFRIYNDNGENYA